MRHLLLALLCLAGTAQAQIQTREIPYTAADGTRLVGYHAWDDAISGPRPGVIVVHEWWGLNDYAKRRARDLAALGYSALAVDMYGDGRNTQHPDDAKAFMNAALADPAIPKARFQAGLELLKAQPQTDPARLAAIGYCFGGKVVLDMARQGLPLAAVVSFHGALVTATPATPGSVKAKVLVEHGAADSFITPEQIAAFKAEMDQAGADYRFVELPGAKHGFSNPDADAHKGHGLDLGYQKDADERSWADMQALFKEVF
ncbi:dienelactone hydrolase family protein [Aquipseudomonas alcaligenes]|uniref:Dienelactone hydrolase n=1 Tax=Aquipseudomonas alcaligenes TaxID=43263 RepID=A0A1N6RXH9_AQUAC|nr:dienelactone hydrolase family protein [Pseudomonas alcaligenes]SIQ33449.1 Dienelactone hydrolase [Pseudomonas alcaligenes]